MQNFLIKTAVLALLSTSFGCVAPRHYEWGGYDQKLYNHYKDPAQKEEFHNAMKEALLEAEGASKVPPGLYAEFGFLMYEQGNSLEAIRYYQKEADKWPESKFFMQKMINVAEKRSAPKTEPTLPAVVAPVDKQADEPTKGVAQ